jgi:NADPH-dependent ferric siderophore reductase
MTVSTPGPGAPDRAPLLALLLSGRCDVGAISFATPATIETARALDAAVAAEVVSSVLAAYAPGADHALAQRAAHVAHELRLAAAIPALVACLERLPHGDPVADVACAALELLGPAAVSSLVDAFAHARTPDARFALGVALTAMPADDGRVRPTLEALLAEDPEAAAQLLAALGDRRAVPALRNALARLPVPDPGPGELDGLDRLVALGEAILTLGGRMAKGERAKFERACARADALVLEGGDGGPGDAGP